jgi:hypothetical protein
MQSFAGFASALPVASENRTSASTTLADRSRSKPPGASIWQKLYAEWTRSGGAGKGGAFSIELATREV